VCFSLETLKAKERKNLKITIFPLFGVKKNVGQKSKEEKIEKNTIQNNLLQKM